MMSLEPAGKLVSLSGNADLLWEAKDLTADFSDERGSEFRLPVFCSPAASFS
jgi:hypothetical protein